MKINPDSVHMKMSLREYGIKLEQKGFSAKL